MIDSEGGKKDRRFAKSARRMSRRVLYFVVEMRLTSR